MATATVFAPHDVNTTLNHLKLVGDEAPFNYMYTLPEGQPITNIKSDLRPAVIHDIRGQEDTVSLDTTGFGFIKHVSEEQKFDNEEVITTRYYKEVEELLKKHTGAKRIFVFDHTIRRPVVEGSGSGQNPPLRGPVTRVHADQTYVAGQKRVRQYLPDEAKRLLKSRVRIINVWRPVENVVAHHPLAVADWRTVNLDIDLVHTRYIYRDREGSTFSVKYNPEHRWYYLGNQTPEEITLIKCFDTDESKVRLTPHSAFLDSSSPKDAPQRQSIEVRCLVFDAE